MSNRQYSKLIKSVVSNKEFDLESFKPFKVLLVDDDPVFRMTVKAMLKNGFEICESESGEKSLEFLKSNEVQLILLDLHMPGMSGIDVIGELSAMEGKSDIPVIILSAADENESILDAFKAGAVDYITKPVKKHELLARVNTHLELRNRQIHLEEMVSERTGKLVEAYEDLESAQTQLLQSEKMASIGQLAAGVAHEINNPVGYVSSNIGTLGNYLNDLFDLIKHYESLERLLSEDQLKVLNKIKQDMDLKYLKDDVNDLLLETTDGLNRVRDIVISLKEFSHVGENKWERANIHDGLNSTLNIVHNEIKYKATIVKEYGDIPDIECIASQLNQVFMNLFVNAAHAIHEKGIIKIKTWKQDEMVIVEISDNGSGISKEVQLKIFDPFFTTKPIGKGTGLGLSLSYQIIEKHHGKIELQSKEGVGTRFTISLPVNQPELDDNHA